MVIQNSIFGNPPLVPESLRTRGTANRCPLPLPTMRYKYFNYLFNLDVILCVYILHKNISLRYIECQPVYDILAAPTTQRHIFVSCDLFFIYRFNTGLTNFISAFAWVLILSLYYKLLVISLCNKDDKIFKILYYPEYKKYYCFKFSFSYGYF